MSKFRRTLIRPLGFALSATLALGGLSEAGAASVGTGVAYPTLGHSLFVNPAGLSDTAKTSLQGAYLLEPGEVHASLVSGFGGVFGVGAGFRNPYNSSIEEFGLGASLSRLRLGVTLRSQKFSGFDADLGSTLDMGSLRLAVVGRGLTSGVQRVDLGLAHRVGQVTVELDVKKPLFAGSQTWLFDASLGVDSGKVSAGVGYTFMYTGETMEGGDFHAGLSLELLESLAAEFFYRPHAHEWAPGDWLLGARATF